MATSMHGQYYYPALGFLHEPAQEALRDVAEAMGFANTTDYLDTLEREGATMLRRLLAAEARCEGSATWPA